MKKFLYFIICLLIFSTSVLSAESLFLRDNLRRAQQGDYIVIRTNKTDTLMHIFDKAGQFLIVEEIAVPSTRKTTGIDWKSWVKNNAPGNTSWVMYEIDLNTGKMHRYYSFTKRGWFDIPDADNFLSKLLNLRLSHIPDNERKKAGLKVFAESKEENFWQPNLIVDGQKIKGVKFDAWRSRWPKDGSDLSGKLIELYLPQDNQFYPSYFPYWLQVQNTVGKSRVRIIDSGTKMDSPKPKNLFSNPGYSQFENRL